MKRNLSKYKKLFILLSVTAVVAVALSISVFAQNINSKLTIPPSVPDQSQLDKQAESDSLKMHYDVRPTYTTDYNEFLNKGEYPADLKSPANVTTETLFDPETGCYIVRTKVGDMEIATPLMLSANEYNDLAIKESMQAYYREKNSYTAQAKKDPFNFLDMKFGLGPLEKIFGPGGVQLKTQGSITVKMGIKSNMTDNPALSMDARRHTYFDFDTKIQATINASVGDKMKFNMTYNTDATFDFDNKNLKLAYEGKEDEIIKNIEAGNVSMTTGSSLIRGSTSLFGIKTKLQFGKLTATALVSQQNAQTQSISTKGGAQTTAFLVNADNYDQNRHYFLAHRFRDTYDDNCSTLPLVSSGVNITRIEVWVTNKQSSFSESRNIVAFMDLGENLHIGNKHWVGDMSSPAPHNNNNNLLYEIKQYPDARYIDKVTGALEPLKAFDFEGGKDYEKVSNARLLSTNEYTLNASLGYISLKSALNNDEVLAVAYQYTYGGKTYQVGEFSGDVTDTSQSLYVKMLKGTTASPKLPMWHIMMKNVYSLGAYQVQSKNFKLNIKYLSDTTGTSLPYIPSGEISGKPLLQVMNLDRLDNNNQGNPDGRFDFLEGFTIIPSQGKVIFPVIEPFGSHLAKQFSSPAEAYKYVYQELYDSTLVVARQIQDKNKFTLEGEYQASSGAQIRLNAVNVPRGSVVVTAGGVTLTENSAYTVDYSMGIVTITNQSIIDAGTNINVSLENQSMFSTQRKTLLGLDLNYEINKDFNIGATVMHYGEKALTEKVGIGEELKNNTIWGVNFAYKTDFMWLTNLLNKIPTVNATAPSTLNVKGEFAHLIPHQAQSGSNKGSSYIDDFESTQSGIDLRSPYSWALAPTPNDFPESQFSDNIDYGKNRALLSWYYIDRMFTQRNSSLVPGYIKNDLDQLSNPYVREVSFSEVFPGREIAYGESSTIQTLNLSYYPKERGPYNLDTDRISDDGSLLNPQGRWGGIVRKLDNTNFEQSNIQYIQFWLMDPFLDDSLDNKDGGDLYFNLGEVSEDILKDGHKSYENGLPADGGETGVTKTVWGKVSNQTSMTYAFDTQSGSRPRQDVGFDGLSTQEEFSFPTYQEYLEKLRGKLSPTTIAAMEQDQFSPLRDPSGDNYHFYRGYDYDEQKLSILQRYKHYNGTEGNSLSQDEASDGLYQSARSVPDVEDINQDNTMNENERYYQYKVSIRPGELVVGQNYVTDMITTSIIGRNGQSQEAKWYQITIPLREYEKKVGSISDFSTVRFVRMYMTNFTETTHLRFATLELIRGEWRPYDYNLNQRGEMPADGSLTVTAVNIEENAGRRPVNYVLPPGVTRIVDSGQSQITQLNEQSMQLKVTGLEAGDARAVYRNSSLDLRIYKRLQMFIHAEALVGEEPTLKNGDVTAFIRLGTDIKNNYYEYEIPLTITPEGHYNSNSTSDRYAVWPESNMLNCDLDVFTNVKKYRNAQKIGGVPGVGYGIRFTQQDPDAPNNRVTVLGNPSLGDVRVMMIGVRNNSNNTRNCIVWVDELRVTDFDQNGGWAAKGNATLSLSDVATVNFAMHRETVGFGNVDQGLSQRRLDEYNQYSVAVQGDAGRFLPEKAKLKAPIYYSYTKDTNTPKYNPLDQDILLKEALDICETKHQRDSIKAYAVTQKTVESFSVSGFKFDVKSKKPMPWDPANFTLNYSMNRQKNTSPEYEFENTSDYRGSFQYSYAPYFKPFKPWGKSKSKSKNMKFLKEWEFNWLPQQITFLTNMSRYYYEQKARNETDVIIDLPVSVSKNFLWDRQFSLHWNFTKTLSMMFSSNTTAHIDEPVGQVNKKLFPDRYREWRDTVLQSLKHLGTPYNYNQTFNASYKAPFNKIPFLDFLNANASYNATYTWERGTKIANVENGNTIRNQAVLNIDGKINFENIYNKVKWLKEVNQRFSGSKKVDRTDVKKQRAKRFERTYTLREDTSTLVKHNLKTKKIKLTATVTGKPVKLEYQVVDENSINITSRMKKNVKILITEAKEEQQKKNFWTEFAQYSARLAMSIRNVSVRFKNTRSLSLPQFRPQIGAIFGQSNAYDVLAPGLDFAFGFTDESYIEKAKSRGWLLCDENQTTPAIYSKAEEFNFEITLEPLKGLKIVVTGNRTDNRTNQNQFMFAENNVLYAGSYTKTHMAIATALRSCSSKNGYQSAAFDQFLENIPIVAERLGAQYVGTRYPTGGFMEGNPLAGKEYDPSQGTVNQMSSDVLIPAFLAAYSGRDARKMNTSPFPSLAAILPNWRVTYDGLSKMEAFKKFFKSFTLTHAYQCTYAVGSYNSYTEWLSIGNSMGFIQNAQNGAPIPSSPYNIASATITEKFAPLVGINATMNNNVTFNAEYRDSRTLTLNSSAGQVVEASSRSLVIGAGYKIANFNSVLKLKGRQTGVSNDLTLNLDFTLSNNTALIRKIQDRITQATSGTRTMSINFTANYILSKKITVGAFFDHQMNTPLVSSSSYPTSNTNFGLSFNMSLAK